MTYFIKEKEEYPELYQEYIGLEYVLTWMYTDDFERDCKRYMAIQKIIYNQE